MRVHREYAQNKATVSSFRFGLNAWPAHPAIRRQRRADPDLNDQSPSVQPVPLNQLPPPPETMNSLTIVYALRVFFSIANPISIAPGIGPP
jgi:hypothetical protein